ncbi:MAG: alpha/beta fold hydrolase [Leptospiraceae bacterium]|nr:alpha/beta fold hydrolase [Leptospiraceae bacterium]MCK6382210.1 alpha/beta fold hydrolase [Leptospiraceae bacterium]NUM41983.1 alpha/beta fold hydrolase [Leptospiraceae bacterium]
MAEPNLFFRKYGDSGQEIIILHGLFGSSKNWVSIAKELSITNRVYTPDLRNHGDSFHSKTHNLRDMADDILRLMEINSIQNPILIGHSMGGLVTIIFSLLYPKKILLPIVVDIAPKNYPLDYKNEFACLKMDVSGYTSRELIDRDMEKIYTDSFIRQFLQMNLEKIDTGYKWKLNVETLENSRDAFKLNLDENIIYPNKALFILGEVSEYVKKDESSIIKKFFSNAEISIIKGAGHYLHYTHQKEFIQIVKNFISDYPK